MNFSTHKIKILANTNFTIQITIEECIKRGLCTIYSTGRSFEHQNYYRCLDCFGSDSNKGCCVVCAEKCHKNHQKVFQADSFYCDCPLTKMGCCAYSEKENIYYKIIFHSACKNENISTEILKVLSKDFNFNALDRNKNSALHYICSSNLSIENLEIIKEDDFLKIALKENSKRQNSFQIAFKNKKISIEICDYFLEKKLSLSDALQYSCLNGKENFVDHLISKKAVVNDNCVLSCLRGKQNLSIFKKMIEFVDYDKLNTKNNLFLSVSLGNLNQSIEMIQFLIDKKSDLVSQNFIELACLNKKVNPKIIQLLIEKSKN